MLNLVYSKWKYLVIYCFIFLLCNSDIFVNVRINENVESTHFSTLNNVFQESVVMVR